MCEPEGQGYVNQDGPDEFLPLLPSQVAIQQAQDELTDQAQDRLAARRAMIGARAVGFLEAVKDFGILGVHQASAEQIVEEWYKK